MGRDRVFIICDQSIPLKIPSDLLGITWQTTTVGESMVAMRKRPFGWLAIRSHAKYKGRAVLE
jgi:hypothetical protein